MAINNEYLTGLNRKKIRKIIVKTIVFITVFITVFFIGIYLFSKRVEKLIKADIQIETVRLENAIKEFKAKTGVYPNISGKENNLKEVKSPDGRYTFDLFYGTEKIYEIPDNLKKGIMKSNSVNLQKDNKGGWFYNIITGEIKPNMD